MSNKITEQERQQLRAMAESYLAESPAEESALLPVEELLHELQVHQIELEMQNESLRQMQLVLEESRDRYLELYDFSPLGYLTLSDSGMIEEINLTAASLLGEDRGALFQRRFARFVATEDSDRWYRHFLALLRQGAARHCEVTLQRADGSCFSAQLDCLRLEHSGAKPVVRIALSDISGRKRDEEELRIAAIAFESQEAMMVTDSLGVILRVNQAFTRLTGYSRDEVVGQTPALLHSGRHDKRFYQQMWHTLHREKHWQGEIWNRRKSGKIYAELLTISAVCEPGGAVSHYVGTFSDITRNSEVEAEIHRLAYYDSLTQLPNRRLLQDRLEQALAATGRNQHCGAVLFLDLDNFKLLNDMHGHDVGDLLLIEVAQRLRACVRAGDTVSRLGGDEFVLLLEGLSAEPDEAAMQARQLGEKVQQSISRSYLLKGHEFECTTSIGIRPFCDNRLSAYELLRHADLALYHSKNAGRNTLHFFDPEMQHRQERRLALVNELRSGFAEQQLQLYFQPQVDNRRGLIGAEALLRWEHPERGVVAPGEFIPLAEETGLMVEIGQWILTTACAQLKAWQNDAVSRELTLAINISSRQFHQVNFVEQVRKALKQSGADPTRLRFELSEGLVLDNLSATLEKMQALKALGIDFAFDDFGTGYCSLSYLTQLPLSQIKIDKGFVLRLPESQRDVIIAQAIISMAANLGLSIIAEGVESESQREFLAAHGCDLYQGDLFSPPLPQDEFEKLLQR